MKGVDAAPLIIHIRRLHHERAARPRAVEALKRYPSTKVRCSVPRFRSRSERNKPSATLMRWARFKFREDLADRLYGPVARETHAGEHRCSVSTVFRIYLGPYGWPVKLGMSKFGKTSSARLAVRLK
jgi:hypothetical protein